MQARLVGVQGPMAGKPVALSPQAALTIGRSQENGLVIASGQASRRHAEIRFDAGVYVLHDLGSANGSRVNGVSVTGMYTLRPGDLIEIGGETFRFEQAVPAAAPAGDATLPAMPPAVAPPVQPNQLPPAPAPRAANQLPPATPAPFTPPPAAPPPRAANQLPPAPAPATPRAGPAAPRRGLPIALVVGLLLACVVLAGVAGVAGMAVARVGPFAAQPTAGSASAQVTAGPAGTDDPGNEPTSGPPPEGQAAWTVLVYLDADNDLERFAMVDFNEMERVGSTGDVNIVVQVDRIELAERDDDSDGDWRDARRYLITRDSDRREIGSELLEELGEVNMGDPNTLADFLTWGIEQYPAQRYAVVLWDHGGAWYGIAYDESSDNDAIVMPELNSALATALQRTGVDRFDLIGFDACLMAQLDVFEAIAPYGRVAVASTELEPGDGWAWDEWLRALVENPGQSAAEIAPVIVESYVDSYAGEDDTVTLSAFDLERYDAIREGFSGLYGAMAANLSGAYAAIAEARSYAAAYSQPTPELFSSVDLGDFAALLIDRNAPESIAGPARELLDAIEGAQIANANGGFHADTSGIAFYFPQTPDAYADIYPEASPIPQNTNWEAFLAAFWTAGEQIGAPPISNLFISDRSVSVNSPATLEGTVTGPDIAYVFFFAGIQTGPEEVLLSDVNFYYPQNVPANIPEWQPGANEISVTFSGTTWGVTNGSETIPVLLGPVKFGSTVYGVEGVYRSTSTGREIDAALLFDVQGGAGTLVQIYGFPTAQRQEPTPFELTPEPGDTFTAYTRLYTIVNGRPEPSLVAGETITFTDQPLAALEIPLASGEYVAGFLVRDIAGAFSYDYVTVTVDNSGAGAVVPTPQASQGSAGQLIYNDPRLGFRMEYPQAWEAFDTGNDLVYFIAPGTNNSTFLAVDIYTFDGDTADERTEALIAVYNEGLSGFPGYTQESELEPFGAGGYPGVSFSYSYTADDGTPIYGTVIFVTSTASGRSYALRLEAPRDQFDANVPVFNAMLDTLEIE